MDGRVAVVTGAASGIGRAVAERLARDGARVACLDRNSDGVGEVAAGIAEAGCEVRGVTVDVSDEAALDAAVAAARDEWGSVDVLVANAGIVGPGTALDTTREVWETVLSVDLTGVWLSIRAALPAMVEQRRGALVTMASVAGIAPRPEVAAYSAAKGGVIALTRQIALDYAPFGIRANAVCPGTTRSPLTEGSHTARAGGDRTTGLALLESKADLLPLRRLGEPADVAATVAFLAGPDSDYVTGTVSVVDGGMTMAFLV